MSTLFGGMTIYQAQKHLAENGPERPERFLDTDHPMLALWSIVHRAACDNFPGGTRHDAWCNQIAIDIANGHQDDPQVIWNRAGMVMFLVCHKGCFRQHTCDDVRQGFTVRWRRWKDRH